MQGQSPDPSVGCQAEFSHWHREHDLWDHDVSRWQADHQCAMVTLEQVAHLIVNHGEALRRHAGDLEAHRQGFGVLDRSGRGAALNQTMIDGMAEQHHRQREVHERIRRHHECAMSLFRALTEALRAPM
jgi:hypothetical protein